MGKLFFNVVGSLFVALGVLGIFLPLLPTTPFLLLAAACYLRGSERLHEWLMGHRHLGPYIRAFQGRSGMPRRAKVYTLALLWLSVLCTALLLSSPIFAVVHAAIAASVTAYLRRIPTMASESGETPADSDA